jgi:hypothetical protein
MTTANYVERRRFALPHRVGDSFLPEGILIDRRREEIRNLIYAHLQPRQRTSLRNQLPLLLAVALGIALGALVIFLLRHTQPSNPLTASPAASVRAEYIWVRFYRMMPVYPVSGFPYAYVPFIFRP